jgi:hypothetical protein
MDESIHVAVALQVGFQPQAQGPLTAVTSQPVEFGHQPASVVILGDSPPLNQLGFAGIQPGHHFAAEPTEKPGLGVVLLWQVGLWAKIENGRFCRGTSLRCGNGKRLRGEIGYCRWYENRLIKKMVSS